MTLAASLTADVCEHANDGRRTRTASAAVGALFFLAACLILSDTPPLDAQREGSGDRPVSAPPPTATTGVLYERLRRLMSDKPKVRRRAANALRKTGPQALIPLVDAYFFMPDEARPDGRQLLEDLSGERLGGRYRDWFLYIGGQSDLTPPPGYVAWKGEVFSRIDPVYGRILRPGTEVLLNLREVHWGGVPLDGIPAIDHPESVPGDSARFMRSTDTVFGVRVGGAHRAYPVKVLSWHELLNDTVAGEPITLSFCTLCGSGILYSALGEGGERLKFGTSGLLYRSNKLMFDRATLSLWSNLTGDAVVGERAAELARLRMLPMTLTRWDTWLRRHPDTTVMVPDPAAARATGYRYVEGSADQARAGIEFPVWQQDDALERNARVYALRINGEAKAYPLDRLRAQRLVHDQLGGTAIVLTVDPESGAVRVYERGTLRFQVPAEPEPLRQLRAEDGSAWWIGEDGLAPEQGGELLPRVPGHVAFWFGWYAFYPETTVYE